MYGLLENHMGHMDRNEYLHLFWRMMDVNQQDISFEGFTKGFKVAGNISLQFIYVIGPAGTLIINLK